MVKRVMSVDIGGHHVSTALFSKNNKSRPTQYRRIDTQITSENILQVFKQAIASVDMGDVSSIGVGVPGIIKQGNVTAPNLLLKQYPLRKKLEQLTKKRVIVENDANLFTLGEAMHGAGKGKKTVVGITLGTGLGGGIVINGNIHHGLCAAGEFGHNTIQINGRKGKTENRGTIESYVSVRGILRTAKEHKLKASSTKELAELATRNVVAKEIWRITGTYLGYAILNVNNTLHPDLFVIGGNVAKAWPHFNEAMKQTANQAVVGKAHIRKAKLGHAQLVGAAHLTGLQHT